MESINKFTIACQNGSIKDVAALIDAKECPNVDDGIRILCRNSNMEILDLVIKKRVHIGKVMLISSEDRNFEMSLKLTEFKIKKEIELVYADTFIIGCATGDIAIVNAMMEKGIGNINSPELTPHEITNNLVKGLYHACSRGKENIVELMFANIKEEEINKIGWSRLLRITFNSGNANLSKIIFDKMADILNIAPQKIIEENQHYLLSDACSKGNIQVIELLMQLGANNWNTGLSSAHKVFNYEIMEMMLKKGATNINILFVKECTTNLDQIKILYKMYNKFFIKTSENIAEHEDNIYSALHQALGFHGNDAVIAFLINNEDIVKHANEIIYHYSAYGGGPYNMCKKLVDKGLKPEKIKGKLNCDEIIKEIGEFKVQTFKVLEGILIGDIVGIVSEYAVL